jgi:hypothetical protein
MQGPDYNLQYNQKQKQTKTKAVQRVLRPSLKNKLEEGAGDLHL